MKHSHVRSLPFSSTFLIKFLSVHGNKFRWNVLHDRPFNSRSNFRPNFRFNFPRENIQLAAKFTLVSSF